MTLAFAKIYSLEIIFVTGNFSCACFPDIIRKKLLHYITTVYIMHLTTH